MPKTFDLFQDMKYNDIDKYKWLKRDARVLKAIYTNKKIPSFLVGKELYYKFKENGIWVSDHVIERFIERGIKNNDFSIEKIIEVCKKEINYVQNHRKIRYYDEISTITEIEYGIEKFITIRKSRVGKDLKEIRK